MLPRPASSVFVVDDQHLIASTLVAILQKNGFSATFFTSPLAALAAARPKAPDLLLSDVIMPELTGIDLALQMKQQHPECRVLLFSAHPETFEMILEARARGHYFPLILKPAHPSEIISEIRKAIRGLHVA